MGNWKMIEIQRRMLSELYTDVVFYKWKNEENAIFTVWEVQGKRVMFGWDKKEMTLKMATQIGLYVPSDFIHYLENEMMKHQMEKNN